MLIVIVILELQSAESEKGGQARKVDDTAKLTAGASNGRGAKQGRGGGKGGMPERKRC